MTNKRATNINQDVNKELVTWVIEIDCPPGPTRPNHLLPEVLEGTGVEPVEPSSTFFGNFVFIFEDLSQDKIDKVKPIVAERCKDLYERGIIRYASW